MNEDLIKHEIIFIKNYKRNNIYKMWVTFTTNNRLNITSINNDIIHSTVNKTFQGNKVGFISFLKNTIFIYLKISFYTLKYRVEKQYYKVDDILIISFGSLLNYIHIYSFFTYSILSFEHSTKNYYISKNNLIKVLFRKVQQWQLLIKPNKTLYNKDAFDYYYISSKILKSLILCDKTKEIIYLNSDNMKAQVIKTVTFSNFILLHTNKKLTILKFDLENEGEIAIEIGKDLITKYYIAYLFIEFNLLIFQLYETSPREFYLFLLKMVIKSVRKAF